MSANTHKPCEHDYHPASLCPECQTKPSELAAMPCSPTFAEWFATMPNQEILAFSSACQGWHKGRSELIATFIVHMHAAVLLGEIDEETSLYVCDVLTGANALGEGLRSPTPDNKTDAP